MSADIKCPKCGQSDFGLASVVRDRGTSIGDTSGTGVSMNGNGNMAVSRYNARTETQSKVARRLDVRKDLMERVNRWGALAFVLGMFPIAIWFIMTADTGNVFAGFAEMVDRLPVLGVALLISIVAGVRAIVVYREGIDEVQRTEDELARSWYCNRCGTIWR